MGRNFRSKDRKTRLKMIEKGKNGGNNIRKVWY